MQITTQTGTFRGVEEGGHTGQTRTYSLLVKGPDRIDFDNLFGRLGWQECECWQLKWGVPETQSFLQP